MNGLKDHQIAALVSKVNDEMRKRYANYGLPQSSRMTVKLAVEDYLSKNGLRLDHVWSDSKIHKELDRLGLGGELYEGK